MGRAVRWVLLVVTLSCACSPRVSHVPPAGTKPSHLARAQALIREGCYRCLEEALAVVHPLAAGSEAARRVAFDAALLLAARDRELGTLASDHLAVARSLSAADARSRTLLAIVAAMPWPKAASGPSERDRALTSWREVESTAPAWRAQLVAGPADDLASQYVLAMLDCTYPATSPDAGGPTLAEPSRTGAPFEAPLLQFRRVVCGLQVSDEIQAMRDRATRWDELAVFQGDAAINGGGLLKAEQRYSEAARSFPAMLPAFHGLARVHVMLEEYEASLPEYDAVLLAVPDQQDCLLGKARALSQLGRYPEAIPLLDRLVELGTWLVGDAHYWRGWDRLQLGDLDGASSDAEVALQLMVNARVHVLAGAIAARRSNWDRARGEFETALPLDETDCDIPVSLGSVLGQQQDWPAAFTTYARAAECLVDSQAQLARRLDEILSAPVSEDRRQRLLARTRAAGSAAHRQEGQARYNAAVSLANQGRTTDARVWAEQASAWPEWRDRANSLASGRRP